MPLAYCLIFSELHIETIDSELRLVAALRRAARERGGPLPSIDVADALLDERRELTGHYPARERLAYRCRTNENPATGSQQWPVHHRTACTRVSAA
jgi:hypothetical protein